METALATDNEANTSKIGDIILEKLNNVSFMPEHETASNKDEQIEINGRHQIKFDTLALYEQWRKESGVKKQAAI